MEFFFKGEMTNTDEVQAIFDDLYSIISGFEYLTSDSKDHVCHTINSIQNHLIKTVNSDPHLPSTIKNIIKLFLYFYQNLYKNAENYFENHLAPGFMISSNNNKSSNTNGNDNDEDDDGDFVISKAPKVNKKAKTAAASKKSTKTASAQNDSNTFDWLKWRQVYLKANMEWIECEPLRLWSMGIIPEVVLGNFWEYSLYILEKRPQGRCRLMSYPLS